MTTVREVCIVRIDCDPVALFHGGYGNILLPADPVLGAGPYIAQGAGELVNVPDYQTLINGTAERLEFRLSGVDPETVRLAREDAPSVKDARVDIGFLSFDEDYNQLGPVQWEATFRAKSLSVGRGVAEIGGTAERTITLTVASGDTRRNRSPMAFFTDADQRRRSGTDAIFSNVAQINAGTSRRFGPSDA